MARWRRKARIPETLLRALFRPEAALRRVDGLGERLRAALVVPARATAAERLDHAERILGEELFPIVPAVLPLPALGFALLGLAGKLSGQGAVPGALQPVLRGLPNNVTTEMDLALWQLATDIRADAGAAAAFEESSPPELARRYRAGELPAVVQSGLAGFLGRYGHRAVAEIDLGMPRWSDDPGHILGVLANYLKLDDPALAPDRQFANAAREAEDRIERLAAAAGSRGGPAGRLRARLVRAALKRTRLFAGLRELPKYHLVEGLGSVRQQLSAVGAELAAAGRIAEADDIFFLDFAEAHRGLAGASMRGTRGGAPGGLRRRTGPPPHPAGAAVRRDRARSAAGPRRNGGGPGPESCPARRPRPEPSPPRHASSWTRRAPGWNRAKSWWRRQRIRAGRRCSSPPADW